jgi:hypothetical protein
MNPTAQAPSAQAPPLHAAAAFAKEHALPQAPQWSGRERSASQPSIPLLLQSAKPGGFS